MVSTGGSSTGHDDLAEILGAQVVWWQLGFRTRRAVIRQARKGNRFPDPEIWAVALGWAHHWLTAPRWWRRVRIAGTTVLAILYLLALAGEWVGVDPFVAFNGALVVCLPPAAAWATRQARVARMLVALAPGPRPEGPSTRVLAIRTSGLLLSVGLAAGVVVVAVAHQHPEGRFCPPFAVDAPVRDWLRHNDGQVGVGCPAGDTRGGQGGVRYTPWNAPNRGVRFGSDYVIYGPRSDRLTVMPMAIFTVWAAEGGPSGRLGEPIGESADHSVCYVNFRGGAIVLPVGGTPRVHFGQRRSVARESGGPCEVLDWPCIATASAAGSGIRLSWRYQTADAFNVAWWRENDPARSRVEREVAGYELTVPGLTAATTYLVEVQACEKHFVRRSTCTRFSPPVIVRVP